MNESITEPTTFSSKENNKSRKRNKEDTAVRITPSEILDLKNQAQSSLVG